MGHAEVNWSDEVPQRRGAFVKVLNPRPGQEVRGIVCCNTIRGVLTHYRMRRTIPCTLPRNECVGCQDRLSQRWKGYLPILVPSTGQVALAELTPEAIRGCPIARDGKQPIAGMILVCRRAGPSPNSRQVLTLDPTLVPLPAVRYQDVDQLLLRMWAGESHAEVME